MNYPVELDYSTIKGHNSDREHAAVIQYIPEYGAKWKDFLQLDILLQQ